jgi:hypothetical protein
MNTQGRSQSRNRVIQMCGSCIEKKYWDLAVSTGAETPVKSTQQRFEQH